MLPPRGGDQYRERHFLGFLGVFKHQKKGLEEGCLHVVVVVIVVVDCLTAVGRVTWRVTAPLKGHTPGRS